jgi:hypothetical protein
VQAAQPVLYTSIFRILAISLSDLPLRERRTHFKAYPGSRGLRPGSAVRIGAQVWGLHRERRPRQSARRRLRSEAEVHLSALRRLSDAAESAQKGTAGISRSRVATYKWRIAMKMIDAAVRSDATDPGLPG